MTVTADCALAIPEQVREGTIGGAPTLGIHVTAGWSDAHQAALLGAVRATLNERPSTKLVLFTDQGGPLHRAISHESALRKFQQLVAHSAAVVEDYSTPDRMVALLSSIDVVVTPKLRVGIVASALGRYVCATPLHLKTIRFYRQIGAEERCIRPELLTSALLAEKVGTGLASDARRPAVPEGMRQAAARNRALLIEFLRGRVEE